jgi:hypothetical protein
LPEPTITESVGNAPMLSFFTYSSPPAYWTTDPEETPTSTELSSEAEAESPGGVQEVSLIQLQLHPAMRLQTNSKITIMPALRIQSPKFTNKTCFINLLYHKFAAEINDYFRIQDINT